MRYKFVCSIHTPEDLPPEFLPEFAFIGRSNVGKSSLLNAIMGQNLAHTSKTPGRTQSINFFQPEDKKCLLVDLPGYGYAKAPQHFLNTWATLISHYLHTRRTLQCVFLLMDARRGLMNTDTTTLAFLNNHPITVYPVLTKIDYLSDSQYTQVRTHTLDSLKPYAFVYPEITGVSVKNKTGVKTLYTRIQNTNPHARKA